MDISPSRGVTALHVLVTVTHASLRLAHFYFSYIKMIISSYEKNSLGVTQFFQL